VENVKIGGAMQLIWFTGEAKICLVLIVGRREELLKRMKIKIPDGKEMLRRW
jgi:hypothetical protein